MNKVITISPEEVIRDNDALYFQIYFVTASGIVAWSRNGLHNPFAIKNGTQSAELFERKEAIDQYYAALRRAREHRDALGRPVNGRLDLVPINIQPYYEEG